MAQWITWFFGFKMCIIIVVIMAGHRNSPPFWFAFLPMRTSILYIYNPVASLRAFNVGVAWISHQGTKRSVHIWKKA
jgi:hypothetical protein